MLEQYHRDGYVIVRQFYKPEEVAEIRELFDKMHADGGVPGHYEVGKLPGAEGDAGIPNDPLAAYPRVTHPHRFNARARYYLIHPRVRMYLEKLFGGKEPVATQSMYFFKAPGSRGQGMHQDNYYLLVEPGTCMGAWAAIDDSDAENGGLMVVPNTQKLELICPDKADRKESFTGQKIPMQKGMMRPIYAEMKAGDMLFFNGNVIHGSGPNRSKTRFRRSWICHYAEGDLRKISQGYNPLVRMDGTDFEVEGQASGTGPCGSESGWLGAVH
ncbi:hypothetical protein AXK11_00110 [Cephaloticoccus primus]|uniref:Phytanoyl-CoA dioxygenase n=1 Tax=Cephaloticoccus primus TaxID=1548207 RepID=A0A139STJ1_9BACT|nr:hypothetical protein AXK11_00110 [Cephaloticoccus primus]